MRKIINGLIYDTETAVLVASDEYISLYKTKNGRFFTYTPPPLTNLDGGKCGCGTIIPLYPSDARRWYEGLREWHVGYAEVFGEEPTDA